MYKRSHGGSTRNKFKMLLGLPVATMVHCTDNKRLKNLYIISMKGIKGNLHKLPIDIVKATIKKGDL